MIAPIYRLVGSTAWGMQLASVVINGAALTMAIWIGHRRAGLMGAVALAVIGAVAVRGYGLNVLTHPWNPYFPVLIWILLLVAAWSVMAGDHWMAIVTVVTASIAAQTHVPYLLGSLAICGLLLVTLIRRHDSRPLLASLGVAGVLWLPPLIDQLIHDPGNISRLMTHFASDPPEPAIGVGAGIRLFLRHLDAPGMAFDLIREPDAFVHRSGLEHGGEWIGLLVLVLWAASAVVAHRRQHRPLDALNTVLAVALAAGAVSMVRIFGKVWFYLTLWAWGTLLLMLFSMAWTAAILLEAHLRKRVAIIVGACAIAGCTLLSLIAVADQEVPEKQLSDGLRAVVPATEQALADGVGAAVGRDGRYYVFWQDGVFSGAQGFGLVNELERDGFDVGVHELWRVPATPHRVVSPDVVDAEVHLVTGDYFIDQWRENPEYVEVVGDDVRTDAERQRFEELRSGVIARLTEIGRDDLVARVDENLFGASLDPDLPDDIVADMSEMLLIGGPIAVFIAPPGASGR
jgi:hypothetical protein